MTTFTQNLDFLLRSKGIRRADLARELNIPQSTIGSWYSRGSEKVSLGILQRIAEYFDVSLEELVNGKPYTAADSLIFTRAEYTDKEMQLLANFAKMLKESR